MRELGGLEQELRKLEGKKIVAEKEMAAYDELNVELKATVEKTRGEIEELRETLQAERVRRRQKIEQETIAESVNKLPARNVTEAKIMQVQNKIDKLEDIKNKVSEIIEKRNKDFHLVLHSVYELKRSLADSRLYTEEEQAILRTSTDEKPEPTKKQKLMEIDEPQPTPSPSP